MELLLDVKSLEYEESLKESHDTQCAAAVYLLLVNNKSLLNVLILLRRLLSEADANCFLAYCSPPNQMTSCPNFRKLKVTA